jgi:trk system potassium uptake protein TrkH
VRIFRYLRENIKLFVWDYIDSVNNTLKLISIFVSFFTMGVIAYFYGFPQTPQSAFLCNIVIHCSLIFYVLKYFLSALFSVHSKKYIFKHKYQGIMIFLIILWFVFSYGFNFQHKFFNAIDIKNIGSMTMLIIQLYFFVMMLFDLSSIGQLFSKLKLGPGGWMISSFIFLISTGTVLLLLPEMTTGGISFIDALFTATSASCVTGLVTLNVATAFTFKGYIVILLLIQFGGINIVAFATFLSSFYVEKKLRYQSVMKEMLSTSLNGTQTLIKEILIYTFAIEIIGTLAFFLYWNHYHFYSDSVFDNLFLSIFHAISAFNNAGISFIDGGMTAPLFRWDHYTQIITGFLIFLGGIGFITIHNMLFSVRYNPNKLKYWSRLQVMSRLTLKVTLFLIVSGALLFLIFESNNSLQGASLGDRICTALLNTVSCRTAGFSTVDTGSLNVSTLLIFIFLMFVGAAPSSTGGGIKITTFYILIKSALATIKGKKEVSVCNRAIPFNLVDRAYAVVLFTLAFIFTGILILSISDPQFDFVNITFEVFSAIGTVGLSMGITPYLSIVGKATLILLMFIGRITIFTLAISVARRAMFTNYSLARTNLNI